MRVFSFSRRRGKVFLWLLVLFFSPPIVGILGGTVTPILYFLVFLPLLFWINIPALLFTISGAALGFELYEFQEFGAMPEGILQWGLIVCFWIVAAFLCSLPADWKSAP